MTPAERKALAFLAGVAVLSAGTRAVTAGGGPAAPATAETRAALARQIAAVDSARRRERAGRGRAGKGTRRPGAAAPAAPTRPVVVDLDVADSAAIERLPRIGPALAGRVVAERLAGGPFGSIRGLERVRGIGPRVAEIVAPHVTFSGTPRPTSAELGSSGRPGEGWRGRGRAPGGLRRVPPAAP